MCRLMKSYILLGEVQDPRAIDPLMQDLKNRNCDAMEHANKSHQKNRIAESSIRYYSTCNFNSVISR
jgi:hypothetical protein